MAAAADQGGVVGGVLLRSGPQGMTGGDSVSPGDGGGKEEVMELLELGDDATESGLWGGGILIRWGSGKVWCWGWEGNEDTSGMVTECIEAVEVEAPWSGLGEERSEGMEMFHESQCSSNLLASTGARP